MSFAPIIAPLVVTALAEITGGTSVEIGTDTTARFFHEAATLADGNVMITGGMLITFTPGPTLQSLDDVAFLDPATGATTDQFTPTGGGGGVTSSLATARSGHTQTTLVDGRVLVTGGRTGASGTNPGTKIASVEIFDPFTGLFTSATSMNITRTDHTATALPDGRVLVAGGASYQLFDPTDDSWSVAVALANARSAHAAVLLEDVPTPGAARVMLVGGTGAGATSIELVDPDTGGTRATSTLATGVDDLAAVRLADGSVLIAGGQNVATGDTIATCYRFDPIGDTLDPVDDVPIANGVADHALVALGAYAVQFGGESQVSGEDTEIDTFAIFASATGSWIATGSMAVAHDDFPAVALPNGEVLLIDGGAPFLGQEFPHDRIERFTPTVPLPADVDCDGDVDFSDVLVVLANWGRCPADALCPADTDDDGMVGFSDLLAVLAAWTG